MLTEIASSAPKLRLACLATLEIGMYHVNFFLQECIYNSKIA